MSVSEDALAAPLQESVASAAAEKLKAIIILCFVILVWGSQMAAIKVTLQVYAVPVTAFLRAAIAAAMFMVIARQEKARWITDGKIVIPLSRKGLFWVALGGIGLGISNLAWNSALTRTTAGAVSVLQLSGNVLFAVYGIVFLAEVCSRKRALALLTSICGILLVCWNGQDLSALTSSQHFIGNLMALVSGLAWTLCGISMKLTIKDRPASMIIGPIFLFSALTCLGPALFTQPLLAPINFWATAILIATAVIGLGIGNYLFAHALRVIPASISAAVSTLTPLVSIICGTIFLHEPLTAYILIGGPIASVGVAMAFLSLGGGNKVSAAPAEVAD